MALFRGGLFAGALFAGLLYGGEPVIPGAIGGELKPSVKRDQYQERKRELEEKAALIEAERILTIQLEAEAVRREAMLERLAEEAEMIRAHLAEVVTIPTVEPLPLVKVEPAELAIIDTEDDEAALMIILAMSCQE